MSSSLKKVSSGISSVIYGNGGIGSALFPQQDTTALDNLLAYYRGVDTSMADDTLSDVPRPSSRLLHENNVSNSITAMIKAKILKQSVFFI